MMKMFSRAVLAAAIMLPAVSAPAQQTERVYDRGSVWSASYIETKPGQFNAYMADLNRNWRLQREAAQKRGDELSYKILSVADTRDGEPNLVLMIEFKNWAVRDRTLAAVEADMRQLAGSLDNAQKLALDREKLRAQRGSRTAVELKFIK
mgnify:CR=1 FL=1